MGLLAARYGLEGSYAVPWLGVYLVDSARSCSSADCGNLILSPSSPFVAFEEGETTLKCADHFRSIGWSAIVGYACLYAGGRDALGALRESEDGDEGRNKMSWIETNTRFTLQTTLMNC